MILMIRVLPQSSKNGVTGLMPDGSLKVKLTAAPIDGKVNEALVELLGEYFGVAKNKITIRRGLIGRNKLVEINI